MTAPELRIRGSEVQVVQGRKTLVKAPLARLAEALETARDVRSRQGVLPREVRLWIERRDAVAVAVELPPQARTVRWLADDSKHPYGRGARYRDVLLSLPYLVLLLVFRGGRLTGLQQLYYRTAPLEAEGDEELRLPNLYNVAEGYGQRCWVCLQHVREAREPASLSQSIRNVVAHVLQAAFNQSAERHEGNSWWEKMRDVDPRVASIEAWEAATRANPWFALEVPWRPAGATLSQELLRMLDRVAAPAPAEPDASWLAGLVAAPPKRSRRRCASP